MRSKPERSHLYMFIRESLASRELEVYSFLLPGGNVAAGLYLCAGLEGGPGHSCITDLDSGIGYDFLTNTCWGDYIDLASQLWNVMAEEAAVNLAAVFGIHLQDYDLRLQSKKKQQLSREIPEKLLISPIPIISPAFPPQHPDLGPPLKYWHYADDKDRTLFYMAQFMDADAREAKTCRPLSLFKNINGKLQWYWQWPLAPYPLYNLPKLMEAKPGSHILVLGNERSAETSSLLFPEYHCTNWPGDTRSVRFADIRPLKDKEVLIWPDNTHFGYLAAATLAEKLLQDGNLPRMVFPPKELPEEWTIGDECPSGLDIETILHAGICLPSQFLEKAQFTYPQSAAKFEKVRELEKGLLPQPSHSKLWL